jgi:hypothetical protein
MADHWVLYHHFKLMDKLILQITSIQQPIESIYEIALALLAY